MDADYRVVIVDDEEASLLYLRSIIDQFCHGFRVVREANDGMEALQALAEEKPDVLITDVRMPGMDGVALAKEARRCYPEITILMISGYSDFEYARGAVSAGAEEYLLKPLNVMQIAGIMENIRGRLDDKYDRLRAETLNAAVYEGKYDPKLFGQLFGPKRFHMAVIRQGNLRSKSRLPYIGESVLPDVQGEERLWLFKGRDRREWICVMPGDAAPERVLKLQEDPEGLPVTIVYSKNVAADALQSTAAKLTEALENRLVMGMNQRIRLGGSGSDGKSAAVDSVLQKMRHCISVSDYQRLKDLLVQWAMECDRTAMPQRLAEDAVDRIASIALDELPVHRDRRRDVRMELEEIFQVARSMTEAMSGVWDILFEAAAREANKDRRQRDNGELMGEIITYIREHYAQPLSVQSVCAAFGVSPTYLSRLFRHESSTTFSELLTECRIEQAKALMLAHGDSKLKDIAQCVGYEDPSYFIKVFKKQTGMTPTQFMDGKLQ